ncbi:MAG: NnrU family protein [Paracoccaceae bacterium]|nr:NnrU family protein [Paracoccaceae bacterium]
MLFLIIGLLLWAGAHGFKRLAPQARQGLGDKGKGLVAVAVLLSVVLMVMGYRGADFVALWSPPAYLVHLNNLLMLIAFYLYAASAAKVWLAVKLRHPQLTAVKIWAVAHLLVNGDLASVVLFGGMLIWAVAEVIMINRAVPVWVPPVRAPAFKEVTTVIITLVVVAVVMGIHFWLGVAPWGIRA